MNRPKDLNENTKKYPTRVNQPKDLIGIGKPEKVQVKSAGKVGSVKAKLFPKTQHTMPRDVFTK